MKKPGDMLRGGLCRVGTFWEGQIINIDILHIDLEISFSCLYLSLAEGLNKNHGYVVKIFLAAAKKAVGSN